MEDLAKYFKAYARRNYKGTIPRALGEIQGEARRLEDWYDELIPDFEYLQTLTKEEMARASQHLAEFGLIEFRYFAEGSTAYCLESNGVALRIGPAPVREIPTRRELSDIRENSPLVLQASHTLKTSKSKVVFETLPFVQVMKRADIPDEFQKLTHRLVHETPFEMNMEDRDLGVLPNGTPIYVDPGAVNVRRWQDAGKDYSHSLFRRNVQRQGLKGPLKWITEKGVYAQERYYPSLPLKRNCTII